MTILIHAVAPIIIHIEYFINMIRIRKRDIFYIYIFAALYLKFNVFYTLTVKEIYKELTYNNMKTVIFIVIVAIILLAHH